MYFIIFCIYWFSLQIKQGNEMVITEMPQ